MKPASGLHRPTFTLLVAAQGWTKGAELGVDKGILFGMLLRECPDLHLIGVDTFPDKNRSRKVFELFNQYADRVTLLEMTTEHASEVIDDQSLDFVFIDADHSYGAVMNDIDAWGRKVKTGGWLGGHDYSKKFPGVVKAVDQCFGPFRQSWPGNIWGVWMKPPVRRTW